MNCHITDGVKWAGARSAGNPHATCDRAGAGNGTKDGLRHQHQGESRWPQLLPEPKVTAPALDPTGWSAPTSPTLDGGTRNTDLGNSAQIPLTNLLTQPVVIHLAVSAACDELGFNGFNPGFHNSIDESDFSTSSFGIPE